MPATSVVVVVVVRMARSRWIPKVRGCPASREPEGVSHALGVAFSGSLTPVACTVGTYYLLNLAPQTRCSLVDALEERLGARSRRTAKTHLPCRTWPSFDTLHVANVCRRFLAAASWTSLQLPAHRVPGFHWPVCPERTTPGCRSAFIYIRRRQW